MALLYYSNGGVNAALAALYGGAIALVNAWLLSSRIGKASDTSAQDAQRGIYILYFGAVQRFVFTLGAFILGMGYLELDPIPLLLTFMLAQAGYWFAAKKGLQSK